jgi:two-component system OmpR family response regulator
MPIVEQTARRRSGNGFAMEALSARARILVVDDEESIRDLLTTALRFTGFAVDTAASGKEALRRAADSAPDLTVLDVNLPDLDGFEICRRLRASGEACPVIFLTARDEPDDLRTGFTGGGDDYLTKPFSLEELVLRIEAVLRRTRRADEPANRLTCGDIVLDEAAHQIWKGGQEVTLSPTEYRLLRYLLLNRDRVLSKRQLLDHVWDDAAAGELSAVETYVSYLRRKLDDRDGRLIQTVRGFGYALRTPVLR